MTQVSLPGQPSSSHGYEHCIILPVPKTPKLCLLSLGSRTQQGQNIESCPQRAEPRAEKCDSKAGVSCQSRGSGSGLRKPPGNGDRC